MKIKTIFISIASLLFSFSTVFSQTTSVDICNTFEGNTNYIYIDTASIWEIGEPNTTNFNNSYEGVNSIVTDLDSLYGINDTSSFCAVFGNVYFGEVFPQAFRIEFNHRFITDSITDYGKIEMSVNNGITWYDVLSSNFNANGLINEHFFEDTGVTQFDSLEITGDSNGWVHSRFSKEVLPMMLNDNISYIDSIIIKFSFITDEIGVNEGWQIDNLCLTVDYPWSINESHFKNELKVYPNPSSGAFSISTQREKDKLSIYNLLGEEVYASKKVEKVVSTNLLPGIYFIALEQDENILTGKIIIE